VEKKYQLTDYRYEAIIIFILFTVVFVVTAPSYLENLLDPDFGSQLSKGQSILFGKHPFINIDSSVYGPAIFYLSALAQWVDTSRLLPEVILIYLGYLFSYLVFCFILKKESQDRKLVFFFAFICIAAFPRFHKYHVLIGPAIFIGSLYWLKNTNSIKTIAIVLAVASAICGLFRIDFGIYSAIASFIYLFFLVVNEDDKKKSYLKYIGIYTIIAVATVLPWIIFIAIQGNIVETIEVFYRTTIGVHLGLAKPLPDYKLEQFPLSRENKHITLYILLKLAPILIITLVMLGHIKKKEPDVGWAASNIVLLPLDRRKLKLVVLSIVSYLYFLQASHRIDMPHIKQALPMVLLPIFLSVGYWKEKNGKREKITLLLTIVVTIIMVVILKHPKLFRIESYQIDNIQTIIEGWKKTKHEIITEALESKSNRNAQQYAETLSYVTKLTEKTDPVLILPFTAQAYYYVSRRFDTPFGWLNPGRFIYPGVEEKFINSLANTKVVLDKPYFSFDGLEERNMRHYAKKLSRHLYEKYGIVRVIGENIVLANDQDIIKQYGVYPLKLSEMARREVIVNEEKTGNKKRGKKYNKCKGEDSEITHVNTLSVKEYGRKRKMVRNSGLLLGLRACKNKEKPKGQCEYVALQGNESTHIVADNKGVPIPLRKLKRDMLIDIAALQEEEYTLKLVSSQKCRVTLGKRRKMQKSVTENDHISIVIQ